MGVDPPFIYDKPSSYTFDGPTNRGFNPKAATQASWSPKAPKPKPDGPLITFNRHPDSYHQSPYGNINATPMNPNTKSRVTVAWKIQRALRVLTLLGLLAAAFCVIAIRNTSTVVGWIIRAGPAIALCHSLYAIYFLCRDVNSRPPASCAGYQMFAGLLDTGLLPFFAIACYMAVMDYLYNTYGWSTLFKDQSVDLKIVLTYVVSSGVVGLTLMVSLVLDVYLAVVYRKITNLPPDLNPLEDKDNLTARPRHKRNKSELVYDKHLSNSTLASQRFSQMTDTSDPGRRVPYKHARTDSADRDSFSFQKDFMNEIRDPYSARASMSADRNAAAVSRPSSAIVPAANARAAGAGLDHKPARSSGLARNSTITRPSSWLTYADYEGMPAESDDYANQHYQSYDRSMCPISASSNRESPVVHRPIPQAPPQQLQTVVEPPSPQRGQENDMPSPEELSLALPPSFTPPRKRSRDPLGMNPPTPIDTRLMDPDLMVRPLSTSTYNTPQRQVLRETDANSVVYATPASRPASFVGSGTKSRFYGNLRSSIGGSPTRGAFEDAADEEGLHRNDTYKSNNSSDSGNFEVYASDSDDEYDPYKSHHGPAEVIRELTPGQQWSGTRQISNSTGNDLQSSYAGLDPEFGKGMARRREVSGKAAEEGRGYEVAVSIVQEQPKLGAAGWARFKGL